MSQRQPSSASCSSALILMARPLVVVAFACMLTLGCALPSQAEDVAAPAEAAITEAPSALPAAQAAAGAPLFRGQPPLVMDVDCQSTCQARCMGKNGYFNCVQRCRALYCQ